MCRALRRRRHRRHRHRHGARGRPRAGVRRVSANSPQVGPPGYPGASFSRGQAMDYIPPAAMHRFANPGRFLRLAAAILPWTTAATVLLIATGLVWGLFFAPPDYQQGESVRIIYVHVPAAWMALFVYTVIALASASALIWRHPLADIAAPAGFPLCAG